ncbi:DUF4124 domain-containing protein [Diaphorobacter caeni]|uniref:DUF4124 domain-containing protein n=1 Tax=Diaphorobacter caeni TaxID=2784387 RepID=UPI00188DF83E|nr:DUF4124 domain-containing protein [Diaphorobacter caeni]MBF5007659.1 DUF4124 domain-containing protein [Diaphorobacter caeni]
MSIDRRTHRSTSGRLPGRLWICALPLLCAMAVQAQVIRCTDPVTGKVSYTDGKCASGNSAQEIEARKSPDEIRAEREQAAQARERVQERQQQDAKRRQNNAELQRSEQESRDRSQSAASNNPANSQACAQARRNLEEVQASMGQGMYDESARLSEAQRNAERACLTPDEWVRTQRDAQYAPAPGNGYYQTYPYVVRPPHVVRPPVRPQPEPKPPVFTNCNVFRCTDAKGNVYPR